MGLINVFDKCHIKITLLKLIFSIILKEESKYKHHYVSRSLSPAVVRGIFAGQLFEGANARIYGTYKQTKRCSVLGKETIWSYARINPASLIPPGPYETKSHT